MFNFLSTLEWIPTFWDDITLAPGLSDNKGLVVDAIVDRCCRLRPEYSDPRLFKRMSDSWFQKHYVEFGKQWDLLQIDYNPIENYDRYEDSEGSGHDNGSFNSTGENKISAMNSSSYQPDTEVVNGGDNSVDRSNKFSSHIHGNIGVTTNQQMIEAERRLLEFNIYEYIAERYEEEFFIRNYT